MPAEATTRTGSYALVAGAVGALAVGWLARGGERGQTAAHPPQATRHSFQDLRSSSVARPSRTDSPDLEAWLTTTREGLIHQRATLARQKVSPSTVVFDASMIPGADAGRRRGLMYIGNAPLPARSTVALYRCLLVRHDAYAEMVRDGTVATAFWNQYAIAMAWPPEPRQWHCLPAGDLAGEGGDWWRMGELSADQLAKAREALRSQVVVDWRASHTQEVSANDVAPDAKGWSESAATSPASAASSPASSASSASASPPSSSLRRKVLLSAHLINEPTGDEPETISHMLGAPCAAHLLWCGATLQAKTLVEVQSGMELTWCYGKGYKRAYTAGRACDSREDDVRERMLRRGGLDTTL